MIEGQETYDIYYDEQGDFLEITFGIPPETEYSEEIEPGVFITRDEETNEIKGIGIISFKKRVEILKRVLEKINKKLPLEISIPNEN
ncbi:hypothetical protein CMI38_02595 [Candidatus Pacearchaeota archaeon]|nr:hypothetical protein [Candidatus Pacearchaeota archaeon]|tara:strand:+ start:362 stop:622 length:261 start_codon:yes stop_codon:yes gene_type:complete